ARHRFWLMRRCGNSSKCWNTMPTRERSFGRSVLGSLTLMPSRMISPSWIGSSALTHLISVDFPEPDGPHTTTTSPLATRVVQSFSAWKVGPYHLLTWLIMIMRSSLADNGNARLQAPDAIGRDTGNGEIDRGREQIHLDQPSVALRHLAGGAEEVRDREHIDQRGVLGQHDIAHALGVGQAKRTGRGRLALRDRLNAGAHDLGEIRRLEQDEGDQRG